jgi:hypothetical protein
VELILRGRKGGGREELRRRMDEKSIPALLINILCDLDGQLDSLLGSYSIPGIDGHNPS